MYGLVRLFYERFYDNFYIAPEDVGASSTVVLAQTAVGLILLFGFVALTAALVCGVLVFYVVLANLFSYLFRRGRRDVVPAWLKTRRALKIIVVLTFSLALFSLFRNLLDATDSAVDCVHAGEASRRSSSGPSLSQSFGSEHSEST